MTQYGLQVIFYNTWQVCFYMFLPDARYFKDSGLHIASYLKQSISSLCNLFCLSLSWKCGHLSRTHFSQNSIGRGHETGQVFCCDTVLELIFFPAVYHSCGFALEQNVGLWIFNPTVDCSLIVNIHGYRNSLLFPSVCATCRTEIHL